MLTFNVFRPAAFMTVKTHTHRRQPDARRDTLPLPQQYQRTMASPQPAATQQQQISRIRTSFPAPNEPLQHFQRAAPTPQFTSDHNTDIEVDSVRSRASSVVSTGTRFSISTLPIEEPSQTDGLLGRLNHASAFRPRSFMSTNSYEQPAPPYESRSAGETPYLPVGHHDPAPSTQSFIALEDSEQSPTTSPENSLSMHYSRVVRTIDRNHSNQMRRIKEAHHEELGATRNAIDHTYRKELKAKAREVEKVREEMASLVATHEADLARLQREAIEQATDQAESHRIEMEKACNAIEDLWEARWSDRMRLAAEETRKASDRAKEEKRKTIERRDQAWIEQLVKRHPDLSDEIKALIDTLDRPREVGNGQASEGKVSP